MIRKIYGFRMKFISVLDYKENYELFDDLAKDTMQIIYKNEDG
jgi:hypothetical protein